MSYTTLMRWHSSWNAPLIETDWRITDLPFIEGQILLGNRWCSDDHDTVLRVGEAPIWAAPRTKRGLKKIPVGLGGKHVCHPEWFATGEPWPVTLPDTVYGPDGWPLCCGYGDDPAEGGVQLGGAAGDVITYTNAADGGYQIGGQAGSREAGVDPAAGGWVLGQQAGDLIAYIDPAAGGLQLGGAAGDVFVFGDPAEGGAQIGGAAGDLIAFIDLSAGGSQLGGAAGDVAGLVDPTAGGFVIGGAAGDGFKYTDATAGGLQIGGAAGDVWTPPSYASAQSNGVDGSVVVTLPTNTSGTGTLFVWLNIDVGNHNVPSGWTLLNFKTNGDGSAVGILAYRAANGATTANFGDEQQSFWRAVAIWANDITTIDNFSTTDSGTNTTIVAPSATSAGAGRKLFNGYFGPGGFTSNITGPGGQTLVTNNGKCAVCVGYENVGSGATGTRTATETHANWAAISTVWH